MDLSGPGIDVKLKERKKDLHIEKMNNYFSKNQIFLITLRKKKLCLRIV